MATRSGPIIVGLLLGGISFWGLNWVGFGWRTVALLHVVPSALTGLAVLYAFRSPLQGQTTRPTFGQYLKSTAPLLRNTTVLGMVAVSALRGMAHRSFAVFLVIHMNENLGYSDLSIGLHVGLLTFLGIVAGPAFGLISDRTGRRGVMVLGHGRDNSDIVQFPLGRLRVVADGHARSAGDFRLFDQLSDDGNGDGCNRARD